MKFSLRTKTIASLIKENSQVIDIGCDHALLSIYLVKYKNISEMIASDISIKALKQGEANIKQHHLQDRIILRNNEGLKAIENNEIDTIVISGLGGNTIVNILNKDKCLLKNVNNIILQPNNNIYIVRKSLCKLGYFIEEEKIIKENNIIYIIVSFKKGNVKYSCKQLYFGPFLLNKMDLLFKELYKNEANKLINTYKNIPWKHLYKKLYILYKLNFIKGVIKQ